MATKHTETKERMNGETMTHAGRTFKSRKRITYRFMVARIMGEWVEDYPSGCRYTVSVECQHTHATAEKRNRDGSRTRLICVRQTVRGCYADVCDYLDSLMSLSSVVSLADGSGVVLSYVL